MIVEILIVIILTLVNGLLAMSELSVVSSRPARLKVLQAEGNKGATVALKLQEDPGKFLSSVQIGITLVGVLSGAFSGATLGDRLGQGLVGAGVDPGIAMPLGVGVVVIIITYLSLIIGELVPKQIALRDPERIASRVAPLMAFIASVGAPLGVPQVGVHDTALPRAVRIDVIGEPPGNNAANSGSASKDAASGAC